MEDDKRIPTNIIQMMIDRKYQLVNEQKSPDTFYPAIFKSLNNKEAIYVYWEKQMIEKRIIINIVQEMRKANVNKAILITPWPISTHARKMFNMYGCDPLPDKMKKKAGIVNYNEDVQSIRCTFELFEEIEFLVNIIQHSLVPQHILMTEDETKKFLSDNQLTLTQLPTIYHSDAVVRYYGFKRGSLIKIVRNYDKEDNFYYRLII